jgi:hypothetical protein
LDLSGVTWTELPKVPDAVKETLALRSLPAGLRQIPDLAFDGCRSLALTALPEGVVSIGSFAFRGCEALRLKALPKGLRSIEEGAFEGCKSLALTTWPKNIKNDGRCGVMVVRGAVKLVRKVKLDPFTMWAGERQRKTYVFEGSGEVTVEGPVVIDRCSGASVTVVAEGLGAPGECPFTITVRRAAEVLGPSDWTAACEDPARGGARGVRVCIEQRDCES